MTSQKRTYEISKETDFRTIHYEPKILLRWQTGTSCLLLLIFPVPLKNHQQSYTNKKSNNLMNKWKSNIKKMASAEAMNFSQSPMHNPSMHHIPLTEAGINALAIALPGKRIRKRSQRYPSKTSSFFSCNFKILSSIVFWITNLTILQVRKLRL